MWMTIAAAATAGRRSIPGEPSFLERGYELVDLMDHTLGRFALRFAHSSS